MGVGAKRARTLAIVLLVVAAAAILTWRKHGRRPANVPEGASFVGGKYIDCPPSLAAGYGQPCRIYEGSTGKFTIVGYLI